MSEGFSGQLLHFLHDTTVPEWIAIVTALAYVILAARENSWAWPFGIISSAIYVWYNFHLKLYNDAWLSVYYCFVGIYGWYAWIRGAAKQENGAQLHQISLRQLLIVLGVGAVISVALGFVTRAFTDSPLPFFDATLTAFSLVATWMTARKTLENWIFWVIIDAAYVVLYFLRNSPATAILFFVYTIIAAYGYFKWKKRLHPSAA